MKVFGRPPSLLSISILLFATTSIAFPDVLRPRTNTETTIVSTITVSGSSPSATASASSSFTNANDLQASILNSTNVYRYEHNATALTWNASLATTAKNWASNCVWKHSGGPDGENLAEGFGNATAAVDAWGDERAQYNFKKPTGFSEATGHFTQLVWKSTTSVGCAAVDCTGKNDMDGWFLVCEYWPPGNVVGENNAFFEQNVQSQIHNSGPSGSGTSSPTGGASGLGNEGTSTRFANAWWMAAVVTAAFGVALGML